MASSLSVGQGTPVVKPIRAATKSAGRSRLSDVASLSRLRRRRTIRQIEQRTGQVVLCYVSQGMEIDVDDVLYFHQLLDTVPPGSSIGLVLNSMGGSIDAAEKLVQMLRHRTSPSDLARTGCLQVIVPDQAKSAATLIAIGADEIVMSNSSELGPTDPYIRVEANGQELLYSAFSYVGAYEAAHKDCSKNPGNKAFGDVLRGFPLVVVEEMRKAISRAHQVTEDILVRRGGLNATWAASKLNDRRRFPSHGQMIDFRTAQDIGLNNVKYMDSSTPLWRMYWSLYRDLRKVAGNNRKVFESRQASLIV